LIDRLKEKNSIRPSLKDSQLHLYTGDTTTGSYEITGMTDTADFHVGDFVTVSAGFPAGVRRIMCKTATSVTLDKAATSDNANVTVSTSDPVFKKMAILES